MGTEQRDRTGEVLAQRMSIGLSTIHGITAFPGQIGLQLKILSGSSLEFGGSYVLGNTGATTAFTWGNGYLVGGTEILSFNGTGSYYLAATGATVVALVLRRLGT